MKIVVAHPAKQHSFKTTAAIKNSGHLFKYITSVYVKKGSLTAICLKMLSGRFYKKLLAHKCDELDDEDIIQFMELDSLLLLILRRVDKKRILVDRLNNYIVNRFNRKLANFVINNSVDILIVYDTCSWDCIDLLKKKKCKTKIVLDMSAPYLEYMNAIFIDETQKYNSEKSKKLIKELESNIYQHRLCISKKEINAAEHFLVASELSKKSLTNYGIDEGKISKCTYGIDIDYYSNKLVRDSAEKKINCIFAGNVTQKKGAYYLLDAIASLAGELFNFTIVGDYDINDINIAKYSDKCNFTGHITKDILLEKYKASDLMVFPSLCDGFGFSVIEALAYGIPVICSKNAGVSDLIIDSYNGFLIPAGDSQAIVEKLTWFLENRDQIEQMRINAYNTALSYTWEKYERCVVDAIETVVGT